MEILSIVFVLFPAVILHECAHGWTAYHLGDPTAKLSGRLTLNPIKHIDPIGTVMVPLLLVISHSNFFFGWAKPVPVNFLNLRYPRRDMILVAAAGPLTNILLAVFFSFLLRMNLSSSVLSDLCGSAVFINLLLAVFNLIPIPPLDGSRLVMGVLPQRLATLYSRMENYGIFIVLILMYLGVLRQIILPLVVTFAYYLGVSLQ